MPRLPRFKLDRTTFVADYGVSWRSPEEAYGLVRDAKAAGWNWVAFHLFDHEYLPELRGGELRAAHEQLVPCMGWIAPRLAQVARDARIGLMLTALSAYVVESAMHWADAMRVPLERTQDTVYAMRWAQAPGRALGVYETGATWPQAAAGRMPLFVSPGYPAKRTAYDPLWNSANLRGRIGVAFHAPDRELFLRGAVLGAPMVSLAVRPVDYANAPDRAFAVPAREADSWLAEVRELGQEE